MSTSSPWHLYLFSALFILAGVYHFIKPRAFMRIMPRYLPNHLALVYLSGLAEIALGILLLVASTRNSAAWGIVIMLFSFFPIHWYMIQNEKAGMGIAKPLLYFRLLLQFALIYWAYSYTITA
jgi:uncharacterized membrane protein